MRRKNWENKFLGSLSILIGLVGVAPMTKAESINEVVLQKVSEDHESEKINGVAHGAPAKSGNASSFKSKASKEGFGASAKITKPAQVKGISSKHSSTAAKKRISSKSDVIR